jgi:hypothetical protein
MMSKIEDKHKWIVENAPDKFDMKYINNMLSQAKNTFNAGNNIKAISSIYQEFKYYKRFAAATQYMAGTRKNKEARPKYTMRSPIENYLEQGSHPSTIREASGSERASEHNDESAEQED